MSSDPSQLPTLTTSDFDSYKASLRQEWEGSMQAPCDPPAMALPSETTAPETITAFAPIGGPDTHDLVWRQLMGRTTRDDAWSMTYNDLEAIAMAYDGRCFY
jgi:hypothetical protein